MERGKKNTMKVFIILLVVAVVVGIGVGTFFILANRKPANGVVRYNIRQAPASPSSYQVTPDDSVPLYFGAALQDNPDRGYRGELYLTLGSGSSYPSDPTPALESLQHEIAEFEEEGVQVYQLYVYLIEFYNKPIPPEALTQLTTYLQSVEKAGKRVLMRFAYEYTDTMKVGPSSKQILSHTQQFKTWFTENDTLVNQTVYAMQLGMFGLWGEGHGSVHWTNGKETNRKKVINAVFDMIPDSMTLMMRTPDYLTLVDEKDKARASIHDDFLIGVEDKWGMIPFNHPDNQTLYNMSQHSIADAELPWGSNNATNQIEPIPLLVQAKNYGLRTLSLKHNYKETKDDSDALKPYYLMQWKDKLLTPEVLVEQGLPYFPVALQNGSVSVYDYLNYHLGYLLCATNLKTQGTNVSFDLINFGMSAPLDFVIEIKTGATIKEIPITMSQLGQFSSKHFEVICPEDADLSVRIKHVRDHSLTIRFANDVPYENGFNLLRSAVA